VIKVLFKNKKSGNIIQITDEKAISIAKSSDSYEEYLPPVSVSSLPKEKTKSTKKTK